MPHYNTSRTLVACLLATLATGCTSAQLRRDTVNQMETVHELQQQQVLDNLAMFVHNRGSLPYFSVVAQGTCSLADTGSLSVTNSWQRSAAGLFLYSALGVNPMLSRQHSGSWLVNPINDSVKLGVMRCVYRKAVEGCLGPSPDDCENCDNLFYAYFNIEPPIPSNTIPYLGGPSNNPLDPSNTPNGASISSTISAVSPILTTFTATLAKAAPDNVYKTWSVVVTTVSNTPETRIITANATAASGVTTFTVSPPFQSAPQVGSLFTVSPPPSVRPPISGVVTSNCLAFRPCWFCWGCKPPRTLWNCKCCRVGHYCGTYVWVPEEGVDELTKLVMLIDDIAYYEPVRTATTTVVVTDQKSSASPGAGGAANAAAQEPTTQVYRTTTASPRTPSVFPYGVLGLQQTLQTAPMFPTSP